MLALVALLTTLGMMREPYSMRDVAGFSHRWQWLHRGRLGMLMLLVAAVVLIAAFNVLEAAGDRNYKGPSRRPGRIPSGRWNWPAPASRRPGR